MGSVVNCFYSISASMAKTMKKTMKKKAMKKSKIARGKRAKSSVFRGTKAKTVGGLSKADLMKNKEGRVVSRKRSAAAKKRFTKNGLNKWIAAVKKARKDLGAVGEDAILLQEKVKRVKALYHLRDTSLGVCPG